MPEDHFGESVAARYDETSAAMFAAEVVDPAVVRQGLVSRHYAMEPDGRTDVNSVPFRYVWPSELDLMARIAGMRLRDRWAGWRHEPFAADSERHVSVWDRA